jgi:DNA-binding MarR family transcriptional regulator
MEMVRVVSRMTTALAQRIKPHGLGIAQFEVLICLHHGEGISQQELAGRMLVTKGNVSITLQKMECENLIIRKTDPADQRYHRLYLTDTGHRLLAVMMPEHQAYLKRLADCLSTAEQADFHTMLLRIQQVMDDLEN